MPEKQRPPGTGNTKGPNRSTVYDASLDGLRPGWQVGPDRDIRGCS